MFLTEMNYIAIPYKFGGSGLLTMPAEPASRSQDGDVETHLPGLVRDT